MIKSIVLLSCLLMISIHVMAEPAVQAAGVQKLEKIQQARPSDQVSVQEEANRKAAADVRRSIQEIVRFQETTWQGKRNCSDSRLSWVTETYSGASKVPKEIWDCAPFACDQDKGVCRASCEKNNNGCASNAECVMTNASGQNGICVSKTK